MDIKAIKELVQKYSAKELIEFAEQLETTGSCPVPLKEEACDTLSDLLQAAHVKEQVDKGVPLQDALREFSKTVREIISNKR